MKTHKNLYNNLISEENLFLAWKKARKDKTDRWYVKLFERNLINNLNKLQKELENQTYSPQPLKMFILRDPKTRKVGKSNFRDRVVHHAIVNIIEPIFDKTFIHDSYANRKDKGTLAAVKRFDKFKRKVSKNGSIIRNNFKDNNYVKGYCLKADIKHYFDTIDHEVLIKIIKKKINDNKLISLIEKILSNHKMRIKSKGMPLGNLTSQFFANVYLNELDYFIKHKLKIKYYIRYVDDFVILYKSKQQLGVWKDEIDEFLQENLKIELHSQKSRIIPLSKGIDFIGYKIFYYFKLLRKRNIRKMDNNIKLFFKEDISHKRLIDCYIGWDGYAKCANAYRLRKKLLSKINIKNQLI